MKLLDTCPETVNEVALEISMGTKADVVHIIGHTIVSINQVKKVFIRSNEYWITWWQVLILSIKGI